MKMRKIYLALLQNRSSKKYFISRYFYENNDQAKEYHGHNFIRLITEYPIEICVSDINDVLKERIEELKQDLKEESNHNNSHIASMISGEIDGINFALEKIKEHTNENK